MPTLRDTVLTEIADEQIHQGEVNIPNRYDLLEEQYRHFETRALAANSAAASAGYRGVRAAP